MTVPKEVIEEIKIEGLKLFSVKKEGYLDISGDRRLPIGLVSTIVRPDKVYYIEVEILWHRDGDINITEKINKQEMKTIAEFLLNRYKNADRVEFRDGTSKVNEIQKAGKSAVENYSNNLRKDKNV